MFNFSDVNYMFNRFNFIFNIIIKNVTGFGLSAIFLIENLCFKVF